MDHSNMVILFSGVAFLIFGLSKASDSLQQLAANQIRKILNRLRDNVAMGVSVGVLLTLMMQSSGAVTATLVNLGTARVLTLSQVMSVIVGSGIGAAITVQLISLHVSSLGLPLFVFGFIASLYTKKRKIRRVFETILAIGIMFFGLELISIGGRAFQSSPEFSDGIQFMRENWMAGVLISAVLTSFMHSSTAMLGIVMSLVSSGAMSIHDSLVFVYGANIGTTSTAFVAAVKGNYLGRRIAWANLIFRVASVIIFLPISSVIVKFIEKTNFGAAAAIASIYLILNVVAMLVFLPLREVGVSIVEKFVVPTDGEDVFGVRFLKRSNYESFALALAHAKREVLEMGDLVYQMTEASINILHGNDPDLLFKVRGFDDRVDLLLREIKLFLIRVSDLAPEGINQAVVDMISFGSDLEGAADIIDHHLLDLAKKKSKQHLEFSREAWRDLDEMHKIAMRTVSLAVTFFQTEDLNLGVQVSELKHEARVLEKSARESHISRLGSNYPAESIGTSAMYLETLHTYLQLVELLSRHAQRGVRPNEKINLG
jgi:phosphate:Na+ symporter